ncbi:uncharacterized protein LOC121379382 [Gigantopelta aegis]|uniref:uncharacterized protein LOC121379382 n=1 Tax=Gigantopelta aegis TaxID=1735272 RepID=UPI001B88E2CA|nr:uncharacterized protein LOC121379382 [Gigantopelta aegis]
MEQGRNQTEARNGAQNGVVEEITMLTDNAVSTHSTKNIKMKQYLSVKHALPKTRLYHTILHENVSQDRHLDMTLSNIKRRRQKESVSCDLSRRAFVAQQDRKIKKWKREDENRLAGMNLPSLAYQDSTQGGESSKEVLYHQPDYESRPWSTQAPVKPVLPMLRIRRERTEIVSFQDKAFLLKLPAVAEIDYKKLERHNTYCGKTMLSRGVPKKDERFESLNAQLQAAKLKKWDQYPIENIFVKSRLSKYSSWKPSVSESPFAAQVKVVVASRPRSVKSVRSGDDESCVKLNFEYVTESRSATRDVLSSIKAKHIKKFAKHLKDKGKEDPTKVNSGVAKKLNDDNAQLQPVDVC